MDYIQENIKNGVKAHLLNGNLFKTDLVSIFITTKLDRENITGNALIPTVLSSGTNKLKTQKELNKNLENLYGAEFNCGVEKIGDNQVLKFYMESINNEYVLTKENLLKEIIEQLFEIVFEPVLENGVFCEDYIRKEKTRLEQIINSKIDNKDEYAKERLIEEMYKNKPYGLYKYGYVEDLKKINSDNLYKQYMDLLNNSKIDIIISGDFKNDEVIDIVKSNKSIEKLVAREPDYNINTLELKDIATEEYVEEKQEIVQGKLFMGLDVLTANNEDGYIASIYNTILGGSANSKFFQNIREKESLAYAIGSAYLKTKNNFILKAGIEIKNVEKTIDLIKVQLADMEDGNFTEEDIANAKKFLEFNIKSLIENQESGITYYLGQELAGEIVSLEEFSEKIRKITKEEIVSFAKKVKINTIYFLRN